MKLYNIKHCKKLCEKMSGKVLPDQWSRDGAHNILQVRASIYSNSWKNEWAKVENLFYELAA